MSSDEDIIPDSPPNPHKLNVVMFRTIKRKVQQTIEIDSFSSADDSEHLIQEEKKESTQQKRRVHKLKSPVPEEKKNLKRRFLPKDESKTFIVDSCSSADDSEHLIQEEKKESTQQKRRLHKLKSPVPEEKKNLKRRFLPKDDSKKFIKYSYSSSDDSEHLIQEGKKESTQEKIREHKLKSPVPEEKKNLMRRFVPKDQIKTFIEQKRRRVAEWVKQVATGQKGLNFPGEVKQTGQRTARSAKVANSAPVTNSAQKKGSTAKSALVANLAPVTNSAQKKGSTARSKKGKETIRYRPHVKCKICNTYQKNIWRHMRLMHDSGKDIKEETKVVSKSGYVIRICPINDCGMIVERMKDHLVRTHKIKRHTKKMERLMKKAEPLTEINKSQDTTSDLIEISSDDECLNVKPIKIEPNDGDSGSNYESGESVEPIKKEMIEFESDFNDYEKYKEQDKDSINSLGFQQTDMKYMDSDSNMSNNERNSTGQTNSVHSLGFVYESPGSMIEVSDTEEEKNTENSPTKRYINKIKHTKEIYSRSQNSQVLKDFANYLVSAPNLKTRRVARQHQHQVCELWLYITPNMTIKDLSSISKLNEWTGKKLATLAPGTIRSYLSSMGLFVDFLMETGLAKHVERFQRFRESLKTIAKKLKRRAKMRRTVVETEEIETMILPVDIQMFLRSETAKTIEKKFDNKSWQVVPSTFYDVRDYMLLRLLQTNAQRPMAVRNITIRSIDRAKRTDDGGLSITVSKSYILFRLIESIPCLTK
ncbi:unnamed protein product [Mytilus coruscus]|uniref:Uncharacterized protein n=1 Tax=Mytilus coruscus TaxID=42192 RepID=A0A6J8CWX4_MYTCO|nr:unnamed protein product [Mytilus coruscus]